MTTISSTTSNYCGEEFLARLRSFLRGYDGRRTPPTLSERMSKVGVLLHPNEHLDDTFELNPTMFDLPPGAYRIEAMLYGWKDDEAARRSVQCLRFFDIIRVL
jgi:hypothetical protein